MICFCNTGSKCPHENSKDIYVVSNVVRDQIKECLEGFEQEKSDNEQLTEGLDKLDFLRQDSYIRKLVGTIQA